MRLALSMFLLASLSGCAAGPQAVTPPVFEDYRETFEVDRSMGLIEGRLPIPPGVSGVRFEADFVAMAPSSSSGDRFGDIDVQFGKGTVNDTIYWGAWSHRCDEEALEDRWGCLSDDDGPLLLVDAPARDGEFRQWVGQGESCWDPADPPASVAFRLSFQETQGSFEVRITQKDNCPTLNA